VAGEQTFVVWVSVHQQQTLGIEIGFSHRNNYIR
jgi:hypothetical protein